MEQIFEKIITGKFSSCQIKESSTNLKENNPKENHN